MAPRKSARALGATSSRARSVANHSGRSGSCGRGQPPGNVLSRRLEFRLPLGVSDACPLRLRGAVRKLNPSSLGAAATLAHMLERCRVRFLPRLSDASKEELEVSGPSHRAAERPLTWLGLPRPVDPVSPLRR